MRAGPNILKIISIVTARQSRCFNPFVKEKDDVSLIDDNNIVLLFQSQSSGMSVRIAYWPSIQ